MRVVYLTIALVAAAPARSQEPLIKVDPPAHPLTTPLEDLAQTPDPPVVIDPDTGLQTCEADWWYPAVLDAVRANPRTLNEFHGIPVVLYSRKHMKTATGGCVAVVGLAPVADVSAQPQAYFYQYWVVPSKRFPGKADVNGDFPYDVPALLSPPMAITRHQP